MFKNYLVGGLTLLFLEAGVHAQLPAALGMPPHSAQPSPASQLVPLHQPAPVIPTASNSPMGLPYPAHTAGLTPQRKFPLEATWDNGLYLESHDKQFQIHVGGNFQWDSTWLIGPHGLFALPSGDRNGTENAAATLLRRVRIRLNGHIFERFDYMVEYDLANAGNENTGLQAPSLNNLAGDPTPTNLWVQVRELPYLGNVRVGQQTKLLGMTTNTSSAFLPFLERASLMDAFYGPFDNGFTTGVSAWNWADEEWLTWRYGLFRPLGDTFGLSLDRYLVAGRITALPVYEAEGRRLFHVGFGSAYGDLLQNVLRVRARPVLRNAPGFAVPVLVDTGNLPGSRQLTFAPELAMVWGPFTVQAEYAAQFLRQSVVGGRNVGTVYFHGGYAQVLYFLTGEHQEYQRREGVFGRVVPRNDFHWKDGDHTGACGAWQVGLRFGYLDLNNGTIRGGQMYDWTLGLNWFLNPNMKIQLNYILTHRAGQQDVARGWINGFGVRAACDF